MRSRVVYIYSISETLSHTQEFRLWLYILVPSNCKAFESMLWGNEVNSACRQAWQASCVQGARDHDRTVLRSFYTPSQFLNVMKDFWNIGFPFLSLYLLCILLYYSLLAYLLTDCCLSTCQSLQLAVCLHAHPSVKDLANSTQLVWSRRYGLFVNFPHRNWKWSRKRENLHQ